MPPRNANGSGGGLKKFLRALVVEFFTTLLLTAAPAFAHAAESDPAPAPAADCLPDGTGFLRARLQGALDAELEWVNSGTECTGAMRPDGGIRLGFARAIYANDERLVLIFGIASLKEAQAARTLPVNVTVIRQGTRQFFGTQGDDKCMLDEIRQEPLTGVPHRNRVYRIVARGFCTEPARALDGSGSILISRFDYAGRLDFADAADERESPSTKEQP